MGDVYFGLESNLPELLLLFAEFCKNLPNESREQIIMASILPCVKVMLLKLEAISPPHFILLTFNLVKCTYLSIDEYKTTLAPHEQSNRFAFCSLF